MNIVSNSDLSKGYTFNELPEKKQKKILELIEKVRTLNLHVEKGPDWDLFHELLRDSLVKRFNTKKQKKILRSAPATPVTVTPKSNQIKSKIDPKVPKISLTSEQYNEMINDLRNNLARLHDPEYANAIMDAFQQNIIEPLKGNASLVYSLLQWIIFNAYFLPLGKNLIEPFKKDMSEQSEFSKYEMEFKKCHFCLEALSKQAIDQMAAFLEEVARLNAVITGELIPPGPNDPKTAIILSVKNGAGGHTAPAIAITNHLRERGWRVEVIHHDIDLEKEADPFVLCQVTFDDGSPMTNDLYTSRWIAQKRNKKESKVVRDFLNSKMNLMSNIVLDQNAKVLLDRILPLKPSLIFTTSSYFWDWQALAWRIPYAKTVAVASDVFFALQHLPFWYRQRDLPEPLRQVYFTTMTEEMDLLLSEGKYHDIYYKKKYPHAHIEEWEHYFKGVELDSQITMIGAPTHSAFVPTTDTEGLNRLREKWGMREGEFQVCISRGKLGYTSDLLPALDSFRTDKKLPQDMAIHVVCGENDDFYEKLKKVDPLVKLTKSENGDIKLGPNIRVVPHPLRTLQDFGEMRSCSDIDDVKGGGASTIEGWLLRARGGKCYLFVTPGKELFWENTNCEAMERWGVAKWIKDDNTNKISIIEDIMKNGLPKNARPFVEWAPLLDKLVEKLVPKR